ncbi:MAG: permease [candidate division KSB1 bacterium]|nr:permease [candidate division KSB1 bacterium]
MNWKNQYKPLLWMVGLFLAAYFLPVEQSRFQQAVHESLALAKWYAREHVILCLLPAFFIAGVIGVFVSQAAVIKYFGARAKKWLAYLVASVSGTVLAVCSCTILPLFTGIYRRGAGIGPAVAFLYSGPAINILAIILTARILGFELGVARVIGAVLFSVVIGLLMHLIYRKEEAEKAAAQAVMPEPEETRPLIQTLFLFVTLIGILVFANWGRPVASSGLWHAIWSQKWIITGGFGVLLAIALVTVLKLSWKHVGLAAAVTVLTAVISPGNPLIPFSAAIFAVAVLLSRQQGEGSEWMSSTWDFAKQILPLLGAGVLVAGLLLGSPEGADGLIPSRWIASLVGGNSLFSNFFASIVGAFMYFATLTEVPILQGLMANGMGDGPALALLLAGPALSLPNMLVIRSVIGTQKTTVFVLLVVVMATISGLIYGGIMAG